jgi:hypothetical protein
MSSQTLPPHAGTHALSGQVRHFRLVKDAAVIAVAGHILPHPCRNPPESQLSYPTGGHLLTMSELDLG